MAIRGGYKYVPAELLEELDRVKIKLGVNKEADCFRKIAENSRIGREIRFTLDFNINRGKRKR